MIPQADPANRPGAHVMPRTPSAATRWRAVIDDFHQAGVKQAEFCRSRGLSLHTFRKYLYVDRDVIRLYTHIASEASQAAMEKVAAEVSGQKPKEAIAPD